MASYLERIHKNPSAALLKNIAKNSKHENARIAIDKDDNLWAADGSNFLHKDLGHEEDYKNIGNQKVVGYVTHHNGNYIVGAWDKGSNLSTPSSHPQLDKLYSAGFENGTEDKDNFSKFSKGGAAEHIPHDDPRYAKNLEKFHGKTPDAIKNSRWYHGTTQDFQKFRRGESGAIFATQDPDFAKDFAKYSESRDSMIGKPNIMPVHVRAENPFDYENPEHLKAVLNKIDYSILADDDVYSIKRYLPTGDWETIEGLNVQKAIKDLGFDSFFVNEGGVKNIGVYDPSQIKSAIGNNGNFDRREEDINKSRGGDVDDITEDDHYNSGWHDYADGGVATPPDYQPQKTVKAYKLFRVKKKEPGKLFPLFVRADEEVPIGQWVEAKAGEPGKNPKKVKSSLGDLAYRPGWHAGDLPIATHIGQRSHKDKKLPPDTRAPNHVWAEVEMPADVDWQSVAESRMERNKDGSPKVSTAHITDQVPFGGFYRYKTNPAMTGNWLIGGQMKVNRLLSDDEVKAINDAAGTADLPRREPSYAEKMDWRDKFADGGAENHIPYDSPKYAKNLKNFHGKTPKAIKEGKWLHGTDRDFQSFMRGPSGAIFVTQDPNFANRYAHTHLSEEELKDAIESARHFKTSEPMLNVMPVHVRAENPFDFENKKHIARLYEEMGPDLIMDPFLYKFMDEVREGHWGAIESSPIQNAIKAMGHDSFFVKENGVKNLGVYDPSQIKSATGNNGNFDRTQDDITKAGGGSAEEPSNDYHLDTHKQLQFIASTERRNSPGAANYYHRSVNSNLHPDLEKYYSQNVLPLLKSAGYPKVGSEEHHSVIKKIVFDWRDDPLDENVKDTAITKADGGALDDAEPGLTAYHGSPHEFEQFDVNKIGTGEGNQSYGHGMYFAQNEEVARNYRDKLSEGTYKTSEGETFDPYTDLEHINIKVAAYRGIDNAINRAMGLRETQPEMADVIDRDLAKLQEMKAKGAKQHQGHMYEVHINAHPEKHFLDWDKPLNEQHEDIQNTIRSIASNAQIDPFEHLALAASIGAHPRSQNYSPKGADLFNDLEEVLGGKVKVSEALSSAGVRGIRYLDAGSRDRMGGTHNYVVFDHDHVRVRRKYMQGGEVEAASVAP